MKIPKRPGTIRDRIKRYERDLRKEKKLFGAFDDSSGTRYLLVPYYVLLGEWRGAVKSNKWFEKNFPNDVGDPFQFICATLAYYKTDDQTNAARLLQKTMFSNLYLVPRLLGQELEPLDVDPYSNTETAAYLDYAPPEYWDLWDEEALAWIGETYESESFVQMRERYIELEKQLKDEPVGPTRSALVEEKSKLVYGTSE
ncbi:MAG: hypothetical protein AAF639_37560 [Chloroflexota bacterium]